MLEANSLLKKRKPNIHRDPCIRMFIAGLFKISKPGNSKNFIIR